MGGRHMAHHRTSHHPGPPWCSVVILCHRSFAFVDRSQHRNADLMWPSKAGNQRSCQWPRRQAAPPGSDMPLASSRGGL
jgi:hypothetical protein